LRGIHRSFGHGLSQEAAAVRGGTMASFLPVSRPLVKNRVDRANILHRNGRGDTRPVGQSGKEIEMSEKGEYYVCEICGAVVFVMNGGAGTLVCCEQDMTPIDEEKAKSLCE